MLGQEAGFSLVERPKRRYTVTIPMHKNQSAGQRLLSSYRLHRGWLGYLVIFAVAFLFFAYFQYSNVFADPDSFYHAKVAVLLRDGQFSSEFTALPFTTLAEAYADHHFLYHLLLVPFVTVIDPLVGLKIATAVFGALLALTFYWFLRREHVPWAMVTTILLLLVNPFTFRMNLAKASSLSVMLLLLGLAAAFAYRPKLLAVMGFFYVWFYGGFLLLVIAVLTFAVVGVLHRRYVRRDDANRLLSRVRALLGRTFRPKGVKRMNLYIALGVVVGTLLGVVVNPFFPDNVSFYFDQIFRIGAVNYQKTIGVGGEWYPYKFIDLVANTVLVSIPLVVALVLFVINWRRQTTRSITLFVLWLFFLILTLKSRRYIEYYVPFGLLFAAVSLRDSLGGISWKSLWGTVQRGYLRTWAARLGGIAFAAYVAVFLPAVVIRDLKSERKDLNNGFRLDLFRDESEWIRDHATPGAVVFHSDWDEFPTLFYWNSESRYIAGLDPTFLYLTGADRYWQWANVTLGKETGDVHRIIQGTFGAEYVFVEHDHTAMNNLIVADDRFRLVHSGPDAKVYHVD